MIADVVRQLGYLALGSRFRRIGERLQADTQRIFKAAGVEIAPALMPTLRALAQNGPLSIGGLAECLGVAQPGVTRNIAQLRAAGLVRTVRRGRDQRVKTIALTEPGEALVALSIRELDPQIFAAVASICDGLHGPFLEQLAALEEALDQAPLDRRGNLPANGGRQ